MKMLMVVRVVAGFYGGLKGVLGQYNMGMGSWEALDEGHFAYEMGRISIHGNLIQLAM